MSPLDQLYSKFFRVMNVGGVYPYSYDVSKMEFSKSLNPLNHYIQIGNFIFIVGMMICHGGLILASTEFFTDVNKVNFLIQLPWIVGLPLSLTINYFEMTCRDLMVACLTLWRRLEHSILGKYTYNSAHDHK